MMWVQEFLVVGYLGGVSSPAFNDDGVPITVPPSWKRATLGAPVPVVRCTYIFPDSHERPGEQCRRWSIRGTTICLVHGGRLPGVQEHSQAVVEAARLRLVEATDEAVDWLLDLGRNATSEAVRLGAAKDVLDRAGAKSADVVDVNVNVGQSPSDVLRERLRKLKERTIDGEVVDTVEPVDSTTPEEETP